MNYLAIDTSGSHLTVIVSYKDKLYKKFIENCNLQHSVTLMPTVEELMLSSKAKLEELDFFCACVGAGSFTGIRIGVSTVKAFSYALNKPVLSVTSFDVLAYNTIGKVLAVIDAKHDNYYVCGYDKDKKVIFPPKFIGIDELKTLVKDYKVVSQSEIDGIQTETVDLCDGFLRAVEEKQSELSNDRESLTPLYIRKSQAEENL